MSAKYKVSGKDWEGYVYGSCPVEGLGIVDGHYWYFKARFNKWSMKIADEEKDETPIPLSEINKISNGEGWLIREKFGENFEASHMKPSIAQDFIKYSIECFREGK